MRQRLPVTVGDVGGGLIPLVLQLLQFDIGAVPQLFIVALQKLLCSHQSLVHYHPTIVRRIVDFLQNHTLKTIKIQTPFSIKTPISSDRKFFNYHTKPTTKNVTTTTPPSCFYVPITLFKCSGLFSPEKAIKIGFFKIFKSD